MAVERDQLARLDELYKRATINGVPDIKMIDADQIREIEPNCRVKIFDFCFFLKTFVFEGLRALHSPHTGIIDYGLLCRHFGKTFEQLGGRIALNFEAVKFLSSGDASYPIVVKSRTDVS